MLLYRIIVIIVMLISNVNVDAMINNENILSISTTSSEIIIYEDGSKSSYFNNSAEFDKIKTIILTLAQDSRESPAFGVSLHNETIDAVNTGLWIEFIFDKTIIHNDLPFESLLINVVGDYTGFNIIRKYNGKYDGRCFYVDLINSNLEPLERAITNL